MTDLFLFFLQSTCDCGTILFASCFIFR